MENKTNQRSKENKNNMSKRKYKTPKVEDLLVYGADLCSDGLSAGTQCSAGYGVGGGGNCVGGAQDNISPG